MSSRSLLFKIQRVRFMYKKGNFMTEDTNITELKGIGEKTAALFARLGIFTVGDLIRYYPRTYEVYEDPVPISEAEEGQVVTVTGALYGQVKIGGSRKMKVTTAYVKDLTGTLRVVWYNMPYLRTQLAGGGAITLRGRIVARKTGLCMEHPQIWYPAGKYEENLHTLQPVYSLTAGLSNHTIMKAMKQALNELDLTKESLPEDIRLKYHLAEYNYAIRGIHFPEDKEMLYQARTRLVFEEFLSFILSMRKLKDSNEKLPNAYPVTVPPEVDTFISELPYELTGAQKKVWAEIARDLSGPCAMSRLIQGDVGSGKTIIAVLALLTVTLNGYQGAMMAPTEVLAKQHYETVSKLLEEHQIPVKVVLLTGSMTAKEKRTVYGQIESGEAQIIIGTHALIQDAVHYRDLALVITDEQHRFGVKQRESLAQKGRTPHVLVMSATPIPRTLAIIVYGDLDISVIDELPANRLPVKNCVVDTSYRKTAYAFIKKQVQEGRQCYVICPMVEDSESLEVENVVDYADTLRAALNEDGSGETPITVEYLHGRMSQAQKDDIMTRFADGKIQVLVSTTVIEVGIDVPNATVMMIENAERFGLAQLHQLRGRVGRGENQSYCIFMSGSRSKETKERLEILNQTNDGFRIASEDLRLRGPGDLFGIRQSGLMNFKLGDIYQDAKILQMANEAAGELLASGREVLTKVPDFEQTEGIVI